MGETFEILAASRRGFMLGGGALLFAKPKLLRSQLPVLWGDGIHDDTEAFGALFSGNPIKTALTQDTFRPLLPGGWTALKGGSYLLSDGIRSTVKSALMGDVTITFTHDVHQILYANPRGIFIEHTDFRVMVVPRSDALGGDCLSLKSSPVDKHSARARSRL